MNIWSLNWAIFCCLYSDRHSRQRDCVTIRHPGQAPLYGARAGIQKSVRSYHFPGFRISLCCASLVRNDGFYVLRHSLQSVNEDKARNLWVEIAWTDSDNISYIGPWKSMERLNLGDIKNASPFFWVCEHLIGYSAFWPIRGRYCNWRVRSTGRKPKAGQAVVIFNENCCCIFRCFYRLPAVNITSLVFKVQWKFEIFKIEQGLPIIVNCNSSPREIKQG